MGNITKFAELFAQCPPAIVFALLAVIAYDYRNGKRELSQVLIHYGLIALALLMAWATKLMFI